MKVNSANYDSAMARAWELRDAEPGTPEALELLDLAQALEEHEDAIGQEPLFLAPLAHAERQKAIANSAKMVAMWREWLQGPCPASL